MLPILALAACADYEYAPANDAHWTPAQIQQAALDKGMVEDGRDFFWEDEDYVYDDYYEEYLYEYDRVNEFYRTYDIEGSLYGTLDALSDDRITLSYIELSQTEHYEDLHDDWGTVHESRSEVDGFLGLEFYLGEDDYCYASIERSAYLFGDENWRFRYNADNPGNGGDYYSCWDKMPGDEAMERINDLLFY